MLIRVVVQNLEHGGHDRWDLLTERIMAASPDLLLLNEAKGWDAQMMDRAARDLGMTALPLPASRSGYHVAQLYRGQTLGQPVDVCGDFSADLTHGVLAAGWDVGLSCPLGVTVTHTSPFSPIDSLNDAMKAAWTASRYGPYSVLGGDFNAPPLYGPGPEVELMSPLDKALRFRDPLADSPTERNTDVAQALADRQFVDAFEVLHRRTGDPQFIAKTGRSDRIDWIAVSEALAPAITDGGLLTEPAGAANHHGLLLTLDTSLISHHGEE